MWTPELLLPFHSPWRVGTHELESARKLFKSIRALHAARSSISDSPAHAPIGRTARIHDKITNRRRRNEECELTSNVRCPMSSPSADSEFLSPTSDCFTFETKARRSFFGLLHLLTSP